MKTKLFKAGNRFYYHHKTGGWLFYYKGNWQPSIVFIVQEVELSKYLKPATPEQFERKYKKNLQRSIKTSIQRSRRALERLRKLCSGEIIMVDDSKMMLGG